MLAAISTARRSAAGATRTGTVYKLTYSDGHWAYSTVHSFNSNTGDSPFGGVTFDTKGNLRHRDRRWYRSLQRGLRGGVGDHAVRAVVSAVVNYQLRRFRHDEFRTASELSFNLSSRPATAALTIAVVFALTLMAIPHRPRPSLYSTTSPAEWMGKTRWSD